MAQLMPLPLTVSCFSKIQISFTFLVPAHLGSPRQRAVKRVCVCVCVCYFDRSLLRCRCCCIWLWTAPVVACSTLVMPSRLFQSLQHLVCFMTKNLYVPLRSTTLHWPTHGNSEQVHLRRFPLTSHLCFTTAPTVTVQPFGRADRTFSIGRWMLVIAVSWPMFQRWTGSLFSFC